MTISNIITKVLGADKKVFAVNFHSSGVEAVYLESSGSGRFKLLAFDVKRISSSDSEIDIISFIQGFQSKNAIHQREIVLSISDNDCVATKYVTMPVLPDEEVLEASRWQLKEEIPFELSDAIIDWRIVKEYTDEEGAKRRGIVFIAAERQAIERFLSLIRNCRLEVVRIVNGSFNYIDILKLHPQIPALSAVLDIGFDDSVLNIYMNQRLCMVRRLPFSVNKFVQSLRGVLISEQGKIEFSQSEAEDIAHRFGIMQDKNQIIKDRIQAVHIISLMRPLLEILIREIKFSFDYFASSFESKRPLTLFLTGAGANLKNLEGYLTAELKIETSTLSLPAVVDTPSAQRAQQNEILCACAAAISGSGTINLLPAEIKRKQSEKIQAAALRVSSIALSAIFAFSLFFVEFQIRDYRTRLKIARLHLETIGTIESLQEKILLKRGLIGKIQENEISFGGVLKAVGTLTPGKVILDSMSLSKASVSLQITGKVFVPEEAAEELLANWINQLEELPFFKEISLGSLRAQGTTQYFEITCHLAGGKPDL